jgi:hypothetical protein
MEHAMLPPVRAALSSNTDYPQQFQPAAGRVSATIPAASGDTEIEASLPQSGGRSDALSLSSQLRLAQGSSIFAETLGRLLKMPRQENETLEDYTARLSEAVQTLKPAERAAVERLLNQIVKGISLRLLAEILKNPTGPDAARLAGYIEAASAAEQDLAAKAVVSSYRQNGSMDAPVNANSPGPRSVPTAPAPAPSQTPAHGTTVAAAVPSEGGSDVALPVTTDADEDGIGTQRGNGGPSAETKSGVATGTLTPANDRAGSSNDGIVARQPGPTAASAPPAGNGLARADGRHASEVQTADETGAGRKDGAPAAPAAGLEKTAGDTAKLYDGPALVRHSLEAARGERWQGQRAQAAGPDRAMPDVARLLAEVMADIDLPQQAQPASRTAATPATTAMSAEEEAKAFAPAAEKMASDASNPGSARQASESAQQQTQSQAAEAGRTGRTPQLAAHDVDQTIGTLPGAWPAVARDGVPLPHVPYPPEEQEPQREERKARAIAEIGDEEDEPPAQDQHFRDDGHEDGGEEEGSEEQEARQPDENGEEGRPNDLYWRMAGWN